MGYVGIMHDEHDPLVWPSFVLVQWGAYRKTRTACQHAHVPVLSATGSAFAWDDGVQ